MSDYLSGFDDWTKAFHGWTDVSISELHGLMTAIMTACQPADQETWASLLHELSFEALPEEALELLALTVRQQPSLPSSKSMTIGRAALPTQGVPPWGVKVKVT